MPSRRLSLRGWFRACRCRLAVWSLRQTLKAKRWPVRHRACLGFGFHGFTCDSVPVWFGSHAVRFLRFQFFRFRFGSTACLRLGGEVQEIFQVSKTPARRTGRRCTHVGSKAVRLILRAQVTIKSSWAVCPLLISTSRRPPGQPAPAAGEAVDPSTDIRLRSSVYCHCISSSTLSLTIVMLLLSRFTEGAAVDMELCSLLSACSQEV